LGWVNNATMEAHNPRVASSLRGARIAGIGILRSGRSDPANAPVRHRRITHRTAMRLKKGVRVSKPRKSGSESPASAEITANKNGRKQRRKVAAEAREAHNRAVTLGMKFPTKTARRKFLDDMRLVVVK
jgi:hypothetical protein